MPTLQEFIETGTNFFKGESGLKTKLAEAEAKIPLLETQVATIDGLNTQLAAAAKTVADQTAELATLRADLTAKTSEVATLNAAIAALKLDTQPGRQAARILATAGVEPVPAAPSTLAGKDFPGLVNAQIAAGKSKAAAIQAVIASNPEEYRAWRTTGGNI